MQNNKIFVYNLGCPKNHKDTEIILSDFLLEGFEYTSIVEEAALIIVNTCSFIDPAKEESIEYIINAVNIKMKTGAKLFVTGCLPELYSKELAKTVKEVDVWLGAKDFSRALSIYKEKISGNLVSNKETQLYINPKMVHSIYNTNFYKEQLSPYTAYVKISEGCSSNCSFCIIPTIRGDIKYREQTEILKEIEAFVKEGVLEITLIAQDLTYNSRFLKDILLSIENLKNKPHWIRLLYCNPWGVDEELIKIIKEKEYIVPYIDFPIQHISDNILKVMNRPTKEKDIRKLLDLLKQNDITIRSSVMVGFPGETEEDFQKLKDLIEEGYFHWLGIFVFSPQENTNAYNMKQLDKNIAIERRNELDALQFTITKMHNEKFIGKELDVIPLGQQDDLYTGRLYFQAPEIDGVSFFKNKLNKLAKCKVLDTNGIDSFCETTCNTDKK